MHLDYSWHSVVRMQDVLAIKSEQTVEIEDSQMGQNPHFLLKIPLDHFQAQSTCL